MKKILIINPNSTKDITDGIAESLDPYCPPNCQLYYFTAPAHAPPSIRDYVTGIQTAAACFDEMINTGAFERFDGFLVCCCECTSSHSRLLLLADVVSLFDIVSDHPLQHMIREHLGPTSSKPCVGMFESGIAKALLVSRQFGIVSTAKDFKPLLQKGVSSFLGASGSDRFVGSEM